MVVGYLEPVQKKTRLIINLTKAPPLYHEQTRYDQGVIEPWYKRVEKYLMGHKAQKKIGNLRPRSVIIVNIVS